MNKLAILLVSMASTTAAAVLLAPTASAQGRQIQQNAMEKARWYNAPREIQITDDRPVVRDFREAPTSPGTFALPPGPVANPGVLPAGGMQFGNPGYRTPQSSSPIPLDKAGFGNHSNIPSSLTSPQRGLPQGTSSGVMGHLPARPAQGARPSAPISKPVAAAAPVARPAAPVGVMSYGAYGTGSSGSSKSSSSSIKGTLLTRVK